MPYWFYDTSATPSGFSYTRIEQVALLGGGLIRSAWERKGSPMYEGWTVTDADMLAVWECEPETSALVIDMKPKGQDVSLFQLWAVSGWTDGSWTPLMLHLRTLFWDDPPDKPIEEFKSSFKRDPAQGKYVRTFMYVRGKGWTRGGIGASSRLLITDGLWDYFAEEQDRYRTWHERGATA